ncbi:MAG TPA: FtsX-like permease family protein [Thermoplasmatales archaeon]|nr:FtsX-like permease family protein [Thermoplasmatales archaeon]
MEGGNEVVIEHHYADRHNIKIGQKIILYVNGKSMDFTVSGICFSPEYIYLISPEGWIEEDFGIFFVPKNIINSSVNTFYIKVSEHNKADEIASNLSTFFMSRGIGAVVKPASKTFTHTAFREDLSAMNSLANLFSFLLLGISAFIIFVVLSRIIEKRRHEIGALRAMGFTKWDIFSHYLGFSSISAVVGVILSIPMASWLLSFIMNYWGATVLKIPHRFLSPELNLSYIFYAGVFAIVFSIVGAFVPSYRAASFTPSEAMRQYIAGRKGARIMSKSLISPEKKLIFRDIFGHRARGISTVMVIALILSLGLSFALSMSSYETGIKERFDKNEVWNIKVSFNTPQNSSVLQALGQNLGAEHIEPYRECGAQISYKNKSVIIQLIELNKNTKMRRFSLISGNVDPDGVLVSGDVAHRLGLKVGSRVSLSTPQGVYEKNVSGIIREFGSSEGYVFKNFIISTGVLLKLEKNEEIQADSMLQNISFIRSWVRKDELKNGWLNLMDEYYGMVYAMDMVTMTLVLLVAALFSFISLMERGWELIVLKSMGFSNGKILGSILWESLILSLISMIFGIPLGMHLANLFNLTFENLISPPPVVMGFNVVITRCLLIIGNVLLTAYIVMCFALKRNIAEKLRRAFETM